MIFSHVKKKKEKRKKKTTKKQTLFTPLQATTREGMQKLESYRRVITSPWGKKKGLRQAYCPECTQHARGRSTGILDFRGSLMWFQSSLRRRSGRAAAGRDIADPYEQRVRQPPCGKSESPSRPRRLSRKQEGIHRGHPPSTPRREAGLGN